MARPKTVFEVTEDNLQTLARYRDKVKKRLAQSQNAMQQALYFSGRAEHYRKLAEELELQLSVGPAFLQIVDSKPEYTLEPEAKPASTD